MIINGFVSSTLFNHVNRLHAIRDKENDLFTTKFSVGVIGNSSIPKRDRLYLIIIML